MKSTVSLIATAGIIGGMVMLGVTPAMAAAEACYPVTAARVYQQAAKPNAPPTASTVRYYAYGYWTQKNGREVYVPPHWG